MADWSDSQLHLDDAHFAMDKYYMARMTSVEHTLYQLNPMSQELDWIKQHAQWLYDSKKTYKLGSLVGIKCHIEAMEECIARKSHELAARQATTTLTTEASPILLPTPVQVPQSGEAPLAVSPDNGCRRLVTSRGLSPVLRRRSQSVHRRNLSLARIRGCFLTRMCFQTPTSKSGQYQVVALRAHRPLALDRTSRSRRGSALYRHRAEGAALRLRRRSRP